ncbi:MAG: hypothetical protein JNK38_28165 [Acidobacteria bacterium]|nr:hypothetical protein [Acidobacteriota bacterium]
MTTAVSQILKQTKLLSPQEQLELVNELLAGTQQFSDLTPKTGTGDEVNDEGDEFEDVIDYSSLKRVPPKDSYEIKVTFVDGGRLQPRRYDFGDLFDDEEEESRD